MSKKIYEVNSVFPCEPISKLLDIFISIGYEIKNKELSDYHFNEFKFILKNKNSDLDFASKIQNLPENIFRLSKSKFNCTCHWSIVEVHIPAETNF